MGTDLCFCAIITKGNSFLNFLFAYIRWSVNLRFCFLIPYFFGYKTEFFSFQNNPKDLDLCWGLFRKDKIGIVAKFHRTDLVI